MKLKKCTKFIRDLPKYLDLLMLETGESFCLRGGGLRCKSRIIA